MRFLLIIGRLRAEPVDGRDAEGFQLRQAVAEGACLRCAAPCARDGIPGVGDHFVGGAGSWVDESDAEAGLG